MTAQWCDDYKGYGTDLSYMLDGIYVVAGGVLTEDPDPNVSGIVLYLNDGLTSGTRRVLSGNRDKVGVAQRYWFSDFPVSAELPYFLRFADEDNTCNVSIAITSTGQIKAFRGNGIAELGASTGPVVTTNAWTHIEAIAEIDDSSGSVEVYVNGVKVIDVDNVDTRAGKDHCAQILNAVNNGFDGVTRAKVYLKDYFVWDSTGTHNNSVAGTVSVIALEPDADVDLTWTPSTGTTGFDILANNPAVDTEYLAAETPPPAPSIFDMTALPDDITSVRCLQTVVRARKVDGGDGNLQVGLISGSDVDLGADRPLTTAFTYYLDISEEDPATDAPWLPSAVDAAQIQIDRTV